MKKNLLITALLCLFGFTANAQKFALIDMEYILKNIPAYERANEQLNQISKKWQSEVEAIALEAQTLYKPAPAAGRAASSARPPPCKFWRRPWGFRSPEAPCSPPPAPT